MISASSLLGYEEKMVRKFDEDFVVIKAN